MEDHRFEEIVLKLGNQLPSPCFLTFEQAIEENLHILNKVQHDAKCKILLALKAYSMYSTFPQLREHLAGTCASGLYEAKLGREEFKKEVHVYSPAYDENEFAQLLDIADYIVLNSYSQYNQFSSAIEKAQRQIHFGFRINPEYSEVETAIYNPCVPGSRFGILANDMKNIKKLPSKIDGLHFHALCQQNSDALQHVLEHVESKFGQWIQKVKWVNFGGGHHITRKDYNLNLLIRLITEFRSKYGVEVYLEPGEAAVYNAGVLVATVMDVIHNDLDIAILDTSAETHLPDVLAMPYRPNIIGAGNPNEFKYTYRLTGRTCLAGDVFGDYSFPEKLLKGQKIIILDTAHYSMVKTTTFNGMPLPAIALWTLKNSLEIIKKFDYSDFKSRLS